MFYFCMNSKAVGVQKARKIAGHFNLPIVGVHHMEAHALVARQELTVNYKCRMATLIITIASGQKNTS